MRLSAPRIAPLQDGDLDAESREALAPFAGRPVLNIFRTLARAPNALTAFLGWGNYVLSRRNGLPAREREIVILRIGWLCRSGYEFAQHRRIALESGLTIEEVERLKRDVEAPGWTAAERALIRACDELHDDQFVSEPTWVELGRWFDDKTRMDVIFTAGQYTQVSMMLNTFGVQLERADDLDPALDLRGEGR